MNYERLLRLADYMEQVPAQKIDMDGYIGLANYDGALEVIRGGLSGERENYKDNRGRVFEGSLLPEGYCGTVCCVLGHATFVPEFREAGLKNKIVVKTEIQPDGKEVPLWVAGDISYKGHFDTDAAAAFFDIPYGDACILFGTASGSYPAYGQDFGQPAPKDIAAGLRRYVEEGGAFWREDKD